MNAMRPWTFQRLKANESEKIESVGMGALIIVGICNLIVISFAPELVHIFSPSSYSGAIALIPPITMGVFFAFMYNLFVDIQMYFEKTKSIMVVAIICASANVITNYIFIKQFGYIAAAYTTLGSYMLMALLHYFAMRRVLKRKGNNIKIYDYRKILFIAGLFLIFGTIMGMLSNFIVIRLIIVLATIIVLIIKRKYIKKIINTLFKKNKIDKEM